MSAFPPCYRASGVLLHVTSLPSPYGIGDVGPTARNWIDRLHAASQSWWQASNYVRFRISPDETGAIGVTLMVPEEAMVGQPVELLARHHPTADEMDAYERVLGDAMAGDATLFAREDYVEEAWRIVDPVLKAGSPVFEYEPRTWGPSEVDQKIVPPGGWNNPIVTG